MIEHLELKQQKKLKVKNLFYMDGLLLIITQPKRCGKINDKIEEG